MGTGVFTETVRIIQARWRAMAYVCVTGFALYVAALAVMLSIGLLEKRAGIVSSGATARAIQFAVQLVCVFAGALVFTWFVQAAAFVQSYASTLAAGGRLFGRVGLLFCIPLLATNAVAFLAHSSVSGAHLLPLLLVPATFVASSVVNLAAVAVSLQESPWGLREAAQALRDRPKFVLRTFCLLGFGLVVLGFFVQQVMFAGTVGYLLSVPVVAYVLAIHAELQRTGSGTRYAWQHARGVAVPSRDVSGGFASGEGLAAAGGHATAAPAQAVAAAAQQFTGAVEPNGSSEHWVEVGAPYHLSVELHWMSPAPIGLYIADPQGQWIDLPAPAQAPYLLELALAPGWHRLVVTAGPLAQQYSLQVRGAFTAAA